MIYYAAAYACTKKGEREKASSYVRKAEAMKTDYCFPNRVAEIAILENAIAAEKNCANACYYLGNLYYDKKQYAQAIELWEKAIRLKKRFRNGV